MHTVFINPLPGGSGLNEATVLPPLGLGYLASILEQNGFSSQIIDANIERLSSRQVMERIPKHTRLIGIYVNSFNYDSTKDLVKCVKAEYPEVKIVLGGPLPSASTRIALENIPCDGVIRGEGEYAILRIVQNLSNGHPAFGKEVVGAAFFDRTKRMVLNPIERIKELDQLPFPAYHLMPPLKMYKVRSRQSPAAAIITSRGCVHECIFCSKDIFQRRVTFRSAENVLDEIDFMVEHYGIRQIDIVDDNFMLNRKRVEQILNGLIQRNYGLSINPQLGIRPDQVDETILRKMKRAGFYKLAFGVESADPEVLKIARKKLDLQKLAQTVMMAKKMGFEVYGFFIIGLPGETEDAFQRTMAFARSTGFDVANFCMAIPFVGTELYKMVENEGQFLIDTTKNISDGFYSGKVFYEYGEMKEADVLRRYKMAYKEFYSMGRKLRILFKVRSMNELVWLWDATKFVLKGVLGSRAKKSHGF